MPIFELTVNLPPFSALMYKKFEALNLHEYQADFLEKKIILQEFFLSPDEYRQYFVELKKYLAINYLYNTHVAMINRKVDAIWHQFLLFTKEYHTFCEKYFGQYMHHTPADEEENNTENIGKLQKDAENFVMLYYQTFGELNDIWFGNN